MAIAVPVRRRSPRRLLIFAIVVLFIAIIGTVVLPPFSVGYQTMWATTRADCVEFGGTPADQGLAYREIKIPARGGGQYRGFFIPGPLKAMILIPPTGPSGRTGSLREAGIVAKHGYAVLSWESRVCAGKPQSLGYREAEDVEDAYAYLQRNSDQLPVSLTHVGLFGFSTAGATVEMAAARNPQFTAVVAEGNYATPSDMATSTTSKPRNLTEALLGLGIRAGYWTSTGEDLANLNPLGSIGQLAPRPVLLVYGSLELAAGADRLIDAYHAAGTNGQISLWVVQGAGHGGYIDQFGESVYAAHVLPFFDCALLAQCRPVETYF